ncbi:MAG: aminotransferase class IV [Prolixibacteraceae bacterium]|nr:aminotransferase class IV [Prolixibacteraceae bacterium]
MPIHSYYIRNEELAPTEQYITNAGAEIYEVCRVMKKTPLFIEEHLSRFYRSAALLNIEILHGQNDIRERLQRLILANDVSEGNIRFAYQPAQKQFEAYFIPHSYPNAAMTRDGVRFGVLCAERTAPNAKVVQASLRGDADRMIAQSGFYEVILVNNRGEATEGSRSNLFFVSGDKLISAPDHEVLCGITRGKILSICSAGGIEVQMKSLPEKEMAAMDAAFITGTSPKILPAASIADVKYKLPNLLTSILIDIYDQQIEEYIKSHGL